MDLKAIEIQKQMQNRKKRLEKEVEKKKIKKKDREEELFMVRDLASSKEVQSLPIFQEEDQEDKLSEDTLSLKSQLIDAQ